MKTKHLQKIFISSMYAMLILVIFFLFPMGAKAQVPNVVPDCIVPPLPPDCCVASAYVPDVTDCSYGYFIYPNGEIWGNNDGVNNYFLASMDSRVVITIKEYGDTVELRAALVGPATWASTSHQILYDKTRMDILQANSKVPYAYPIPERNGTPLNVNFPWAWDNKVLYPYQSDLKFMKLDGAAGAANGQYVHIYLIQDADGDVVMVNSGEVFEFFTFYFAKKTPGPVLATDFGFYAADFGPDVNLMGGRVLPTPYPIINPICLYPRSPSIPSSRLAIPKLFEYRYPSSVMTHDPLSVNAKKATLSGTFKLGDYPSIDTIPIATAYPTQDTDPYVTSPWTGPQPDIRAFDIKNIGYASTDTIAEYGFIYTKSTNPNIDFDDYHDFIKDFMVGIGGGTPETFDVDDLLAGGMIVTSTNDTLYIVKATTNANGGYSAPIDLEANEHYCYWAFSINQYSTIEAFLNIGEMKEFDAIDCMDVPDLTIPDLCNTGVLPIIINNNTYYQGLLTGSWSIRDIHYEWYLDDGSGEVLLAVTDDTNPQLDISGYGAGTYRVRAITAQDYPTLDSAFCEADTSVVIIPCGGAFVITQFAGNLLVSDPVTCNDSTITRVIYVENTSTTASYDFKMVITDAPGTVYLSHAEDPPGTTTYNPVTHEWETTLPIPPTGTVELEIIYDSYHNPGSTCLELLHIATLTEVNGVVLPPGFQTIDTTRSIVAPTPYADQVADIEVCVGTVTAPITITGLYTYFDYIVTGPAIGLADGYGVTEIPSFTAINTTTAPITVTVEVIPYYDCGGVIACDGDPMTFDITVNPDPTILAIYNQAYCSGTMVPTIDLFYFAEPFGSTVEWEVVGGDNLGLSDLYGVDSIRTFPAMNYGSVVLSDLIKVTPVYKGCVGEPKYFILSVMPEMVADQPADLTVCSNTAIPTIHFSGKAVEGHYLWEAMSATDATAIGMAISGHDFISAFTAHNYTTDIIDVEIAIIPYMDVSGTRCVGDTVFFTISVNPEPAVYQEDDHFICAEDAYNYDPYITFYDPNGVATRFFWEASSNAALIGLELEGYDTLDDNDFLNGYPENNTSEPITVQIKVTPGHVYFDSFNNELYCYGEPMYFNITVSPTPELMAVSPQEHCVGELTAGIDFGSLNAPTGTKFHWWNDKIAIGLPDEGEGNIPPFTVLVPDTATITVIAEYPNGSVTCASDFIQFTIIGYEIPVMTPIENITVCNGDYVDVPTFQSTVQQTTFKWRLIAGTYLGDGLLEVEGIGQFHDFTAVNNGSTVLTALYGVTPNSGAHCDGPEIYFTITVNPTPIASAVADQAYCHGDNVAPYTFTGNVIGATYYWEQTNWLTDPQTMLPRDGYNELPAFAAVNTSAFPIVLEYTVYPSFENNGVVCEGDPIDFTITIHPAPEVVPMPDMYFCDGDVIGDIAFSGGIDYEYRWLQISGDVINDPYEPPYLDLFAGDSGDIPSFTAVNTGNTILHAVIQVTPWSSDGSCSGTPIEFTIYVGPKATMYSIADQNVCVGDWTAEVDFGALNAPAGTIFNWWNDNTSIGTVASGTGNIPSFEVTADVVATFRVTSTNNGVAFCSGDTITFTITGRERPVMAPIVNITVCDGDEVIVPDFMSNAIIPVYEWRFVGGDDIGYDLVGTGNMLPFYAFNPGTTQLAAVYAVKVTEAGYCESDEVFFTIFVNPIPVADEVGDGTYCSGTQVPEHTFTGNTPNATYHWFQTNYMLENIPELPQEGWNVLPAFLAMNTTLYPIVLEYELTPYYEYAGVACEGETVYFTITINPTPEVEPLPDLSFCAGTDTDEIIFTGYADEYHWIQISGDVITNDYDLFGGGVDVLPSFETVNNGNVPLIATIRVTPWSADDYCTGEAIYFTITVKPTPTVDQIGDQKLCSGEFTSDIIFTGDTQGTIFRWTVAMDPAGADINMDPSGVGNIPSFQVHNFTTEPITATISVVPEFKSDPFEACPGDTMVFHIIVNPIPEVDPIADIAYCSTTTLTEEIVFTGTVSYDYAEYRWVQVSGDVITDDFDMFAGGKDTIPAFIPKNAGNTVLTAYIEVTPWTKDNLCHGATIAFTISIIPKPTVDQIPDQEVCAGEYLDYDIIFTGNTPGTIYRWTNVTSPAGTYMGLGTSGVGNILAFTTENTTNSPIVATIKVVPEVLQGTSPCTGDTMTFTITVNPAPIMDPVSNVTYCVSSAAVTIPFTSSNMTGNVQYDWYVDDIANADSIGMEALLTGIYGQGPITFIPKNNTNNPITVWVTVTPSSIAGDDILCSGVPVTFSITVDPTPTIFAVANQEVCAGAWTAPISFNGSVPGTQFHWTVNDPYENIGLPAEGWGDIDSFEAENTTNAPIMITVHVIPVFGSGAMICDGNPPFIEFTITVNPTPVVAPLNDVTYCASDFIINPLPPYDTMWLVTTDIPDFTSTADPYAEYTWTKVDGPYIGETQISGTGNFVNFVTVNDGVNPLTATYKVTATVNGICESVPVYFSITVNPIPHLDPVVNKVYCSNWEVPEYHFTGTVPGSIYTWSFVSGDDIGLVPNAGTGSMPSFITIYNDTDQVKMAKYQVTVTYNNNGVSCGGEIQEFFISVLPNATVTNLQNVVVCNNDWVDTPMFEGVATSWEWLFIDGQDPGLYQNNGEGQFPSFTAQNTGATPITALYEVIPYYEVEGIKCEGYPHGFFSITVNPQPIINTVPDMIYCERETVPAYAFSGTFNAVYRWERTDMPGGDYIGNVPNSGIGIIPSFTAMNDKDGLPAVAEFKVTAEYLNSNGTTCYSEQFFTITVMPAVEVLFNDIQTEYCDGDRVFINFSEHSNIPPTSVMDVHYEWNQVGGDNIGSIMSGIDILTFTATNPGTTPLSALYVVTPTFEYQGHLCNGKEQRFTLTVYPRGTITLAEDNTYEVCNNEESVDITYMTTQMGMDLVYTLTFLPDAPAVGFQDVTTFTDLPKDFFTIKLPKDVPAGVYEAVLTIRAKAATLNTCTSEYIIRIDVKQYFAITAEFESVDELIICDDSELVLTIAVTPANAPVTYTWYHDGKVIEGANTNTYRKFPVTKEDEGDYYVVVTGDAICGEAMSSIVHVTIQQALVEQKWDDVLYVDNSKGLYHSYLWYRILDDGSKSYLKDDNGQPITGQYYYSENEPLRGTYGVEAYGVNGQLIAESCPYTPQTSTKNIITIYPNPVSQGGTLTVFMDMDSEKISGSRIVVYDMVGKQIALRVVDGRTTHVTMEVVPGAYVVRITSASGEVMKSEKVIVR